MHLISSLYTVSSVISLLFEALYLLFGVIVLVLSGVVAADRKKLVTAGGALIVLGALGDLAVQIWSFYALYMGAVSPVAPAPDLLHLVFTLVFLGGLLTLVLAAVRRVPGPAAAPTPGPRPGPHPSPTR
ncbi:hypothetical protein [Nocardiopsis sp. HUAS JQ3]|uniref:hypothetical protein n=1 Tax=Nocardiopsis sp. HUAS JQ3 TaxID=3061629 RepID=UPI0023A92ED4|nr:hypothetical protein [Nocardiopsis sp. HUAS JQ3]WDZ91380.1 hypothetical protein PV789_02065 [Nocardiopsis sp. HUAS JQ3]